MKITQKVYPIHNKMSSQKQQSTQKTQLKPPTFNSYRIKLQYNTMTRFYEIPYDIELRGLVVGLRKWLSVPNNQSIFLHLKHSTSILSLNTRLSQLTTHASLLTQKTEQTNYHKEGKWEDIKMSHQFMEKDVVKCEPFIELKMISQETTG